MAKVLNISEDPKSKEKSQLFIKNVNSDMHYKSELSSEGSNFDWLDEIEFALTYLDNIVRSPRVILVSEQEVVKIERAKKITVESVKDLARNTFYIEKIDPKNQDVQPSKILEVHNEESYNTYENRFIYSLIDLMTKFVAKKEKLIDSLENKNKKTLEYTASTNINGEHVDVRVKLNSSLNSKYEKDKDALKELKERIKKVKQYLSIWSKSELIKSLQKARASFVVPPIKKTNLILKNPNFQIATRLWEFLYSYDLKDHNVEDEGLDTAGTNTLKDILNDSFLTQYFVLDSISDSKREQKEQLSKYALIMLKQQVERSISLLLNCGVKITDEQILEMVAEVIKNEKNKKTVGKNDVKKKFKSIMDEYLENTQSYL